MVDFACDCPLLSPVLKQTGDSSFAPPQVRTRKQTRTRFTCRPAASAATTFRTSQSSGATARPWLMALSAYGSWNSAVEEPREPSANACGATIIQDNATITIIRILLCPVYGGQKRCRLLEGVCLTLTKQICMAEATGFGVVSEK